MVREGRGDVAAVVHGRARVMIGRHCSACSFYSIWPQGYGARPNSEQDERRRGAGPGADDAVGSVWQAQGRRGRVYPVLNNGTCPWTPWSGVNERCVRLRVVGLGAVKEYS